MIYLTPLSKHKDKVYLMLLTNFATSGAHQGIVNSDFREKFLLYKIFHVKISISKHKNFHFEDTFTLSFGSENGWWEK